MRTQELEERPHRTPILRKAFAGLVLVIVAALAIKIVVGFVIAIFGIIVVVAAIAAVLWAAKTLFW